MSNPRDHYRNMQLMKAKMVITYAKLHMASYDQQYRSQVKTDIVLLEMMLKNDAETTAIEDQINNIVDQCVFGEGM